MFLTVSVVITFILAEVTVHRSHVFATDPASCRTPVETPGRRYTVYCSHDNADPACQPRAGDLVPPFTTISIWCDPGYGYKDERGNISICVRQTWQPPIIECIKTCKGLKPVDAALSCVYYGIKVNCDGPLKPGTRVRQTCLPGYKPQSPTAYAELECQQNGKWSDILFRCIPNCGTPLNKGMSTTAEGTKPQPWHAWIYNTEKKDFICGGTIVSPNFIISAARCFYDEQRKMKINETNFEIAVSKTTKDYKKKDNPETQIYKVKAVHFHPKGYYGQDTNYVLDIVILETVTKITLSETVLPACMDWSQAQKFNYIMPVLGQVAMWADGNSERGSKSFVTEMQYVNYEKCVQSVLDGTKRYITEDKFCAVSNAGSVIDNVQSGTGILMKADGLFYLTGVLGIKLTGEKIRVIFTNVTDYVGWLEDVDKKRLLGEITLNAQRTCKKLKEPTDVYLQCYYHNEEVDCKAPLRPGAKIRQTCPPAYRPLQSRSSSEITCEENGEWDDTLFSCVPDCGLPFDPEHVSETRIVQGTPAKYGDSPWNVAIYNVSSKILICSGTIITPDLIVSAAHCFYDESVRRRVEATDYEIMVSKVTRDYYQIDNRQTAVYKVKRIFFPPRDYYGRQTNYASDIAVLQTDKKILLSPEVRPVCIYWVRRHRFNPKLGTIGKIVGWGIDDTDDESGSPILLTAELPFINYEQCLQIAPDEFKPYITDDKFCAGNFTGAGVRRGDSGGGLVFDAEDRYYLFGVVSTRPIGMTNSLAAFTDISAHIDWLNRVRADIDKTDDDEEKTLQRSGGCQIPLQEMGRRYSVYCPEYDYADPVCRAQPGDYVRSYTSISVWCDRGFTYELDRGGNISLCIEGKWQPAVGQCYKTCDELRSEDVTISCNREGKEVNCSAPLTTGTLVRSSCVPGYRTEARSAYQEILCDENGRWNDTLLKCSPESEKVCTIPSHSVGTKYKIHCSAGICEAEPGEHVVQYSTISVICDAGYAYSNGEDSNSSCVGGTWTPSIRECTKTCVLPKEAKYDYLNVTCFYQGAEVKCAAPVKPRTEVHTSCASGYWPQSGRMSQSYVICQEDGTWDQHFLKCVPACGVPIKRKEVSVLEGTSYQYGDMPWHMTIYDTTKQTPICGGTIISPYLVIAAAHCFYDESGKNKKNVAKFELMVSKVTKAYNQLDNPATQKYKVKTIHFPTKGYYGAATYYASDIAIIESTDKIKLSSSVLPACVDWKRRDKFNIPIGKIGKIMAWSNGNFSERIHSVELKYVSYEKCLEMATSDFRAFVTVDKFCASSISGSLDNEQFAGGLVFKIQELYYLVGVVSVRPMRNSELYGFTSISDHIDWLNKVKNDVEKSCIALEKL